MSLSAADFRNLGLTENAEVVQFLRETSLQKTSQQKTSLQSCSQQNCSLQNCCDTLHLWHRLTPWVSPIVPRGDFEIFDFTSGYDSQRKLNFDFGIGRYDEDRVGMYNADFFESGDPVARRTIHMGLDLGAPAGTPVFSPVSGTLLGTEFLNREGDYGGTIILECAPPKELNCPPLYMLFGHLAKASLQYVKSVLEIRPGDLIGWLGEPRENGGWNPHLHWQLSWSRPLKIDLPGAVSASDREKAKLVFPDPTWLLSKAVGGWKQMNVSLLS